MPALKPRDRKQEARPSDEIDSEENSEGNERRRFTSASPRVLGSPEEQAGYGSLRQLP